MKAIKKLMMTLGDDNGDGRNMERSDEEYGNKCDLKRSH